MDKKDAQRVIIHVDMDAFFASVEQRDNPALRGKPVIVGGSAANRGVVSAASYEARQFGVRSAMSMAKAMQLCPQGIRVPVNGKAYREASLIIMNILRHSADEVEPVSIDEAYLDISQQAADFKQAETLGLQLKQEIKLQTQLTASVGIAPNKFLAKIASDYDKPDGFCIIRPEQVMTFLEPLPVRVIPGVGVKTEEKLKRNQLATITELRQVSSEELIGMLGEKHGQRLYQLARGVDHNPVQSQRLRKSVSQERTFMHDLADRTIMKKFLQELSAEVAEVLEAKQLKGRTIGIKVRFNDFKIITRSVSIEHFTRSSDEINNIANLLFDKVQFYNRKVRLLGVRVALLNNQPIVRQPAHHNPEQLTFW